MRWAAYAQARERLDDALEEGLETIVEGLDGEQPDLLLAFPSANYRAALSHLPRTVADAFDSTLLLGCTAGGVIGDGRELEDVPALSLLGAVLPGVTLAAHHLESPKTWPELDVDPDEAVAMIVLPDPFTFALEDHLEWLDTQFPSTAKFGGVASGGLEPGSTHLFIGDRRVSTGAVCLTMSGNVEVETIVAQGCRPIGPPFFITRSEGNFVMELDGKPATSALDSVFRELASEDQERSRHALFVGLGMREDGAEYGLGDFLVRHIVGLDPRTGAIGVGALAQVGQVLQFQLRDRETSASELVEMLSQRNPRAPHGALMFSCLGRGRHLFGEPNYESRVFGELTENTPLAGFFCNGEIGPVRERTFLHGYTSAFGLFRPRPQ